MFNLPLIPFLYLLILQILIFSHQTKNFSFFSFLCVCLSLFLLSSWISSHFFSLFVFLFLSFFLSSVYSSNTFCSHKMEFLITLLWHQVNLSTLTKVKNTRERCWTFISGDIFCVYSVCIKNIFVFQHTLLPSLILKSIYDITLLLTFLGHGVLTQNIYRL